MTNLRLATGFGDVPNFLGSQPNGARKELNSAMPCREGLTAVQSDVRRARTLRNLRRELLGVANYSGPGWEILLHLYDSHLHQLRDTVGNIADGTDIPTTTALRWITRLEADGLLITKDDPLDARRKFVELTGRAVDVMTRYFVGATTHLIAA